MGFKLELASRRKEARGALSVKLGLFLFRGNACENHLHLCVSRATSAQDPDPRLAALGAEELDLHCRIRIGATLGHHEAEQAAAHRIRSSIR